VKHVTYFDPATGLLTGVSHMLSDDSAVALNTPKGFIAIEHPQGGMLDHMCQRVDLEKLKAEEDAAATAWQAVKDENRLKRTAGGDPGEDPPPPARSIASIAHVVDYQPAAPSSDHEWNITSKRWQPNAAMRQRAADALLARHLEGVQHGLVRRLTLNPADTEARTKLHALHDQITALEGSS
jgi:hypothetical protein